MEMVARRLGRYELGEKTLGHLAEACLGGGVASAALRKRREWLRSLSLIYLQVLVAVTQCAK